MRVSNFERIDKASSWGVVNALLQVRYMSSIPLGEAIAPWDDVEAKKDKNVTARSTVRQAPRNLGNSRVAGWCLARLTSH